MTIKQGPNHKGLHIRIDEAAEIKFRFKKPPEGLSLIALDEMHIRLIALACGLSPRLLPMNTESTEPNDH